MLHPDFWNRGIMKEALKAVIPYGFNIIKLHRIEATTNPHKAHFKEDCFFSVHFLDNVAYSLLNNK
jgi:[ribosomal protein S5]-alanine N-acetyltransferase